MAGERKEPGFGRPSTGGRRGEGDDPQQDFLDLIPERLAARRSHRTPDPRPSPPPAAPEEPPAEPHLGDPDFHQAAREEDDEPMDLRGLEIGDEAPFDAGRPGAAGIDDGEPAPMAGVPDEADRAGAAGSPDFRSELARSDDDDLSTGAPPLGGRAARSRKAAPPPPIDTDLAQGENDGEEAEDDGVGSSRAVMAAVVVGAVAAGIAGWYLFLREEPQQVAATPPVIAADDQPYKVRPADPGGMAVPDTDKMVYDRLGQNSDGNGVETLLPETDAPQAPPRPASEPSAAGTGVGAEGTMPDLPEQDVAAAPEPTPVPDETPEAAPAPAPTPEDAAAAGDTGADASPPPEAPETETAAASTGGTPVAPPPKPDAPPAQAEPAPEPTQSAAATPAATPDAAAPAGGGAEMVQLAALRDAEAARTAWTRLQSAHPDLLGDLTLDVQRADLGDRGIFYRVRAKGLASSAEASALCDQLKARDVACIVVR